MVLDEPRDNDEIFKLEGLTYVVEKGLFERAKPIKVDYIVSPFGSGFQITSNLMLSGGSCGTSCSTCS